MKIMFAAMLGGWELVLILAIFLILFGSKKLPELARGLGQGIKEFKKAAREVTDEVKNAADEAPPQQHKSVSSGEQSQPGQTVSQSSTPPKS